MPKKEARPESAGRGVPLNASVEILGDRWFVADYSRHDGCGDSAAFKEFLESPRKRIATNIFGGSSAQAGSLWNYFPQRETLPTAERLIYFAHPPKGIDLAPVLTENGPVGCRSRKDRQSGRWSVKCERTRSKLFLRCGNAGPKKTIHSAAK